MARKENQVLNFFCRFYLFSNLVSSQFKEQEKRQNRERVDGVEQTGF